MITMKRDIVCALCVFLLSGCAYDQADKAAQGSAYGQVYGAAMVLAHMDAQFDVAILCHQYHQFNCRWPGSLEELREFCAEAEDVCDDLNIPDHVEQFFENCLTGIWKSRIV